MLLGENIEKKFYVLTVEKDFSINKNKLSRKFLNQLD